MSSKKDDFWCQECSKSVPGMCRKHGGFHQVYDNVIPSRARLTLPQGLVVKPVKTADGKQTFGVFAKRIVHVKSQYGPLMAPVKSREKIEPKNDKNTEQVSNTTDNQAQISTATENKVMVEVVTENILHQQAVGDDASNELIGQSLLVTEPQQQTVISSQPLQQGPFGDVSVSQSLQNYFTNANSLNTVENLSQTVPFVSGHIEGDLTLPNSLDGGIPVTQTLPTSSNTQLVMDPQLMQSQLPLTVNPIMNTQLSVDADGNVAVSALTVQTSLGVNEGVNQVPTHLIVHENGSVESVQGHLPVVTQTGNQLPLSDNIILNPSTGEVMEGPSNERVEEVSDAGKLPQSEQELIETEGVMIQGEATPDHSIQQQGDKINNNNTGDDDVPKISENKMAEQTYDLKVFKEDGFVETLDFSDEDKCNWMMFVRPAKSAAEQNLMAYQYGDHVFYVSTKPIPSNTELKVWYSADYAEQMGKDLLLEDDSEQKSGDYPAKWVCSICFEGFSTFADLEAHPCSGMPPGAKRLRGRPRKGRPRKYVKPSRTWRARLEKTRLKARVQDPAVPNIPRRRGRPPKIKQPELEKPPQPVPIMDPATHSSPPRVIEDDDEEEPSTEELLNDILGVEDEDFDPIIPKKRGRKRKNFKIPKTPKTPRGPRKEPMQCSYCDEKFTKEQIFVVHVAEHTGIKPYICEHPDCKKGFMSKFKLERHRLIHTCPRHHKCPYCDKSFNRKDHLKNHLITHDPNKKRWVCEECGKEYSYNFSYRTHKAFHDAEAGRTTECGICHKQHETRDELLYHLKVHSGARSVKNCTEKTHACPECGKKFYTRKDVRRHMITHTKKKDFLCQYCPQRFGRKDHLTRHLRSSHSGDNPNAKPPRAPRGERKERIKQYETVTLPIIQREEPAILVTTQPSLNNVYPMHTIQTEQREVPLPIHLYENINAQPIISMPVQQQQPQHQQQQQQPQQQQQQQQIQHQQTLHAPANQYTIEVNAQAITQAIRQVNQGMESPTANNDYRNIQHHGAMYLGQPQQQHHAMIANKDVNVELVRTNGVLQSDFQPNRDQGRPTVLQTGDARQTPSTQTFSTLLGYMETLRFLENLPTNAQTGVIAQMDTSHPPTMVPIQTTPYSTSSATNLVPPHQTEIKRMPVSHHNAYQQGS